MQTALGEIGKNDKYIEGFEDRLSYAEVEVEGEQFEGTCQDYQSFLSGDLVAGAIGFGVKRVEFMSLYNLSDTTEADYMTEYNLTQPVRQGGDPSSPGMNTFVLDDEAKALIVINWLAGITTDRTEIRFDHVDNNSYASEWVLKDCPTTASGGTMSPSLCLNCTDPCNDALKCDKDLLLQRYIAPCAYQACDIDTQRTKPAIRILSVAFIEAQPAPEVVTMNVIPGSDAIVVDAQLEYAGSLYCQAFNYVKDDETGAYEPYELSYTDEIVQGNFISSSTPSGNFDVNVTISNLYALTNYTVYCMTRNYQGTISTFAKAQATQQEVVTICCRKAIVDIRQNVVLTGSDPVTSLFTVTLDTIADPPPVFTITSTLMKCTTAIAYSPFYTNYVDVDQLFDLSNKSYVATDATRSDYDPTFEFIVEKYDIFPGLISYPSRNTYTFGVPTLGPEDMGRYMINLNISCRPPEKLWYEFFNVSVNATQMGYNWTTPRDTSHEYEIVYERSTTFVVIEPSSNLALEEPIMIAAMYSDDGKYVSIIFDSPTNRGGKSSVFSCDALFTFNGASDSTCRWIDSMTVNAYISGSSSAEPGDTISIIASSGITSYCDPDANLKDCSIWPDASQGPSITITAPEYPAHPRVSVRVPKVTSACGSLDIDLSGSRGNAGREWKSVDVIASSSTTTNLTALNSWLAAEYASATAVVGKPSPIPLGLLTARHKYEFEVTLCNFLDACGVGSMATVYLDTDIPSPKIQGLQSRKQYRSSALLVKGDIIFDCNSNLTVGKQRNLVEVEWELRREGLTPVYNVLTTSRDPYRFMLPAYSLDSNMVYKLVMIATVKGTRARSSTSVIIFVPESDLVPLVRGGNVKNMNPGGTLLLDASQSYDPDVQAGYDRLTGRMTDTWPSYGFEFTWTCQQTLPTFVEDCVLDLGDVEYYPSRKLVTVPESAGDTTHEIIFTIVDVKGGNSKLPDRSVSETITVHVSSSPDLPILTLDGDRGVESKMNADERLALSAEISVSNRQNYTATRVPGLQDNCKWSVDDVGTDLEQVAKTPFAFDLKRSFTSNYLVIAKNTLPSGNDLMFTLTCNVGDIKTGSFAESVSSITIKVNSPPVPGTFAVTNPDGADPTGTRNYALKDLLYFLASNWEDDDDVMFYQFGYYANLDRTQRVSILRSRSEVSFADLMLPAGRSKENHMVTAVVEVSDPLDATTTATDTIAMTYQVLKSARPKTEIAGSIMELINSSAGGSVDEQWASLSLSVSVMSNAECDSAPDCAALNRHPCSVTDQTCGECWTAASNSSVMYIGDAGEGNTLCQSVAITEMSNNASSLHTTEKTCANDCTSDTNGICVFKGIHSDHYFDECFIFDGFCEAVCVCEDGFSGPDCSYTDEEMRSIRSAKQKVVERLDDLRYLEDTDKYTLEGMVSTIAVVADNKYEMDESTAAHLGTLAGNMITDCTNIDESYESVESVLSALDNTAYVRGMGSTSHLSGSNRRRRTLLQAGRDAILAHRRMLEGNTLGGVDEEAGKDDTLSLSHQYLNSGGGLAPASQAALGVVHSGSPSSSSAYSTATSKSESASSSSDDRDSNSNVSSRRLSSSSGSHESLFTRPRRRLWENEAEKKVARNAVQAVLALSESSMERRQEKKAAAASLEDNLRAYGDLVASSIYQGEYAVETKQSQFRMVTLAVDSQPTGTNTTEYHSLPQTDYEILTNVSATSIGLVLLPNDTSAAQSAVSKMSAISIRSGLSGNENFSSNPLKFHFSSLPCDPSSDNTSQTCEVDLVLQMNEYVNYTATVYDEIVTYCYFDEFNTVPVTCPSGQTTTVQCPGSFGSIVTRCPHLQAVSLCNGVNDTNRAMTSGCEMVDFTETNVTCRCPVGIGYADKHEVFVKPTDVHALDDMRRRRLSEESGVASDSDFFSDYEDRSPIDGQATATGADYGYLYDAPATPDEGGEYALSEEEEAAMSMRRRSRRRRKLDESSTSTNIDTAFVSMTSNAVADFADTWSDVGALRVKDLIVGWQVLIFGLFIIVASTAGMFLGAAQDKKDWQALIEVQAKKIEKERRLSQFGTSTKTSFMRSHGDSLTDGMEDLADTFAASVAPMINGGAGGGMLSITEGDESRNSESGGSNTPGGSRPGTASSTITESLLRTVGLHLTDDTNTKIAPITENDGLGDDDEEDREDHRELKGDEEAVALAALHAHNVKNAKAPRASMLALTNNAVAPEPEAGEVAVATNRRRIRHRKDKEKKDTLKVGEEGSELHHFNAKKGMDQTADNEIRLVDAAVPRFMRLSVSESFAAKVVHEMKQNHRWLSLYFRYDQDHSRASRLLHMLTGVVISFFLTSLLFGIGDEDDGTCELQQSEATCLALVSAYDSSRSRCYWFTKNVFGQCAYTQPASDINIILYMTLLVSVIAVPLLFMFDYVITNYIEPPTEGDDEARVQPVPSHMMASSSSANGGRAAAAGSSLSAVSPGLGINIGSTSFGDQADASQWYDTPRDLAMSGDTADGSEIRSAVPPSPIRAPQPSPGLLSMFGKGGNPSNTTTMTVASPNKAGTVAPPSGAASVAGGRAKKSVDNVSRALMELQAQAMLEPLNKDLHSYRRTLYACDVKDLQEFDDAWGLDYKGDISSVADNSLTATLLRAADKATLVVRSCLPTLDQAHLIMGKTRPKDYFPTMSKIAFEMERVKLIADNELQHLETLKNVYGPGAFEKKAGARVMYLFQRDLLPGLSGMLLENKTDRENMYRQVSTAVPKWKKNLAWGFVLTCNLFFVLYMVLFGLTRSTELQQAWLLTLVLWLFLDIIIYGTFACFLVHVFLPLTVMKRLLKVRLQLATEMRKLAKKLRRRTNKEDLRAKIMSAFKDEAIKPVGISATAYRRAAREDGTTGRKIRRRVPSKPATPAIEAGAAAAGAGGSSSEAGASGAETRPASSANLNAEDRETREAETRRRRQLRAQQEKLAQLEELQSSSDDETHRNKKEASKLLNATKYFFVSYKVAQEFPELRESMAVMRYSIQFPPDTTMFASHESGHLLEEEWYENLSLEKIMRTPVRLIHKVVVQWIGGFFAILLSTFLSTSVLLQDFAVDEVVASLFAYLCYWHVYLYNIHPTLAFLPVLSFMFLCHFLFSAMSSSMRLQAHSELDYDEATHNKFLNERKARNAAEDAKNAAKNGGVDMINDPFAPRNVTDLSASTKRRKRRRVKRRNPGGSAGTMVTTDTAADMQSRPTSVDTRSVVSATDTETEDESDAEGSSRASSRGAAAAGRRMRNRFNNAPVIMEAQNEDDDNDVAPGALGKVKMPLLPLGQSVSSEERLKNQEREDSYRAAKDQYTEHTQRTAAEAARMKIALRATKVQSQRSIKLKAIVMDNSSDGEGSVGSVIEADADTERDGEKKGSSFAPTVATAAVAAVPSSPTGGLSIAEQMRRNREMRAAQQAQDATVAGSGKRRNRRDRPKRISASGNAADDETAAATAATATADSHQTTTPFGGEDDSNAETAVSEQDDNVVDHHANHGMSNTISW
jgi:hypothetical protein